jgi:predicted nucleotidyltransferase
MRPTETVMPERWTLDEPGAAVQAILAGHGVALAVLFGSGARGTARADSDVDIGVRLVGGELTLEHDLELTVALERALHREVDLVDLDRATPLLRREAARGRCLYEREPGAFGDFVARALLEFDDVQPHLVRCGRGMLRKLGGKR